MISLSAVLWLALGIVTYVGAIVLLAGGVLQYIVIGGIFFLTALVILFTVLVRA